ncbi:hypothetical protein GX441_00350 [bacterium]|nr:hypothetical protein [bacterium]
MAQDNRPWIRMMLGMLFSFIIAGAAQAGYGLVAGSANLWGSVFQIAVIAAVFGFLLVAFRERGILYVLISCIVVAVLAGLFGRFQMSIIIVMLIILGLEFVGLFFLILGDFLGKSSAILRALSSMIGGVFAGAIIFGFIGLLLPATGFFNGILSGLPYIIEISFGVSLGAFFTRITFGERQPKIKVKES